jgi:hypothetical protein
MALFEKLFANVMGAVTGRKAPAMEPGSKTREDEIREQRKRNAATIQKAIDKWAKDRPGDETEEEKRKREMQAREPAYRFIYLGIPIINGVEFTSSNVMWIQYDLENSSLYVTYKKNGCTYRYWPVSVVEARTFYHMASKGETVWDLLRKRGTNLGHQKNYILVGGSAAGTLPKWAQDPAAIAAHDAEVAETSGMGFTPEILQPGQTGAQPYRAIGKFLRHTPEGTVVLSKE